MQDTIVYRNIAELKTAPNNYRSGDVGAIITSILKFGFNGAIRVWKEDVVKAGNHTLLALQSIKAQGLPAPRGIRKEGNTWLAPCVDISHLTATEADAFMVADNRLTELATNDEQQLATLLSSIAAQDQTLLLATGYDGDDVDSMLRALASYNNSSDYDGDEQDEDGTPDDEQRGSGSDGSLLALVHVAIDNPTHQVERGQVWQVGPHYLICADVLSDWQLWAPYLTGDNTLFAPYPGPFVALTVKAEAMKVIMVQPDVWISGHILDRYAEIKGASNVKRVD